MELERAYYEEAKKPMPDNAVMDGIEFELYLIVSGFTSEAERSKIKNM